MGNSEKLRLHSRDPRKSSKLARGPGLQAVLKGRPFLLPSQRKQWMSSCLQEVHSSFFLTPSLASDLHPTTRSKHFISQVMAHLWFCWTGSHLDVNLLEKSGSFRDITVQTKFGWTGRGSLEMYFCWKMQMTV